MGSMGKVRKAAPIQRAISIRQPYAALILRRIKTHEFRSRATKIRERAWIYAAFKPANATFDQLAAKHDEFVARSNYALAMRLGLIRGL